KMQDCLWFLELVKVQLEVERLATKPLESTLEGTSVTLSYKYKNTAKGSDRFYWYQQFPGKPTKFLISHSGTGTPISQPVPGFSFKVSDDQRQMDLQISSAVVTDSAVYYCAVRPTVTGNNKTLYKNLQQHNTTKYPLEGVTHCESHEC
uniref:Ig-like domain-containing protein n=1 Tax=Oryzias latipes TaxID=8090 RepID=A0A3B3H3Z9_ORYLA